MDRGKIPDLAARSNRIYLDLEDIIKENALPFLPAKSAVKFQAVCRDWRLQISAPLFAHKQSLSCNSTSGIFSQLNRGSPFLIPIDANSCGVPDPFLNFLPEPVDIKSSSNGLLCCRGREGDKVYYICNPFTKQWKELPKSNAYHGSDPAIVLLFEPSLLNFVAEYKIICAFPSTDFDKATEFDIYYSREGCWKIAEEMCFGSRTIFPKSGIHVNGVVYWMTSKNILAFDLTKGRTQLLESYGTRGFLGTFSGKLCKVDVSGDIISLNVLANTHSNTMQIGSQIKMWSEKEIVVLDSEIVGDGAARNHTVLHVDSDIMVVLCGRRTCSYDFKSRLTKFLSSKVGILDRCFPYVNSLVSL
ncbi:F-box protein At5g49610 [Solanum lycopersicum]|uniref:BAC19.2 n=1 Tax=Solanum lycopersicum TaxID=4081 RepID=Q9FYX4_SOLLC|nr:F-box protein At5g49610 [Solanum lycopersicum]XP_010316352.1 F-box protein At5g49610 [Solanum lycopersicum]XP_025885310.1 F-box protein At5g49610 [Solanum lycopersicum]AAG01117.1 BAC19.2 [Solanum lycopersicum]